MDTKSTRVLQLRHLLTTNTGPPQIVELYKSYFGHFPPWGTGPYAMIDAIAEYEEAAAHGAAAGTTETKSLTASEPGAHPVPNAISVTNQAPSINTSSTQ